MRIHLISSDEHVYNICREALAGCAGKEWDFTRTDPGGPTPTADLYIWDCGADLAVPQRLEFADAQKNILLVQRKQLGSLGKRLPLGAVAVLLKPINPPALRTFVQHAAAHHESHQFGAGMSRLECLRAEREDLLQCLLQANLKLQEYDQDRTNFLARALHDFRTPLTAVNGYCGLLLGQQVGLLNTEQTEVLQRMHHSIKRLSRMATAMFQLSVGRQVKKAPELEAGDIEACIEQALREVMLFVEEKHIDVSFRLTCPPQPLYFEPSQIEQVLINLLENACKFTPRNGSIEIHGYPTFWERRGVAFCTNDQQVDRRTFQSKTANAYCVQVRDSGSGVPAGQLEQIFEEYTSYSGGRDRTGGGLGLAICKMIVSAHRGRIWAESGTDGAAFSFVIPFIQGTAQLMPGEPQSVGAPLILNH